MSQPTASSSSSATHHNGVRRQHVGDEAVVEAERLVQRVVKDAQHEERQQREAHNEQYEYEGEEE